MNIAICCPSYKRPKVKTLNYIPWCRVYVDGSEYDDYVKENEGANIIRCKDGIQGNLCRVRNYILDVEFENGADVVCIIDDDMEGMYLWVCNEDNHTMKKEKILTDGIETIIEKYSLVCQELGFKFWGGNCNQDALSYKPCIPFAFSGYIGGPLQVFLRGNECRYDERLPLKEDYDMALQNCNKYRGCLRVNSLTYNVKQSEQAGGCASYRNIQREKEQFELLQKKWGGKIVREDKSNKGQTKNKKGLITTLLLKYR